MLDSQEKVEHDGEKRTETKSQLLNLPLFLISSEAMKKQVPTAE